MPTPPAATPALFTGAAARRWMDEHGWTTENSTDLRVSADHLRDASFSVARIWHSPARLHRRQPPRDSDAIVVLVGLDGSGHLSDGERAWQIGPRQVIVADAGLPLLLTANEPCARLEITTQRRRLGTAQMLLTPGIDAIDAEESYWRTIASLIITVLGTGVRAQDSGFVSLRSAIEHAVAAAIMPSPRGTTARGGSTGSLLMQAQRVIEEQFMDQAFSATELARELAISSAHLHRVFAPTAITPYQMIQQRRVNRASDLLRDGIATDAEIAAQSGFSSLRGMRRALQKSLQERERIA